MTRIVCDANVLISAAITRDPRSPAARVFDAALDGRLTLILSPTLLDEITIVLARPKFRRYLTLDQANRFVDDLQALGHLVADAPPPHPAVCRDPADDYLIALAAHIGADALVSGDRDLLDLPPTHPPITSARALAEQLDL